METNNKEFIKLDKVLIIILGCMLLSFLLIESKEVIFLISLISISSFYFIAKSILKDFFIDIRSVIKYVSEGKEFIIKDGDLGLMYDEITLLKNRTIAYEETIELEKAKLRQSIEDICHQLKTPLTSVSIYTELLLGKDNENEYLMNIDQQVQKINYLIQGLLKLAKLQSHQVKFGFEDLSINQVMQMAIESLQSICQDTQITIQQTDLHFYYDESWLQEALSNIIKNSLEENCQHISISFEEHQQYIKVFIYNDGKEIDEKDLPHIFERFYHTSKQQGVGIGLALAKEIIERHHGSISAYNQNGVIFELTFPKYQVSQKYKVS